jgi:hypothetical protein
MILSQILTPSIEKSPILFHIAIDSGISNHTEGFERYNDGNFSIIKSGQK